MLAAAFFLVGFVLASQLDYFPKDVTLLFFGFHFMLPFLHYNAIPDDLGVEMRSIFQDFYSTRSKESFKIANERYAKVIHSMESLCGELCNKKLTPPPHNIFRVDTAFCQSLRPKMQNWFYLQASNFPDKEVFTEFKMSSMTDVNAFERNLVELGNSVVSIFSLRYLELLPSSKLNLPGTNFCLRVLTDISSTFKICLTKKDLASEFQLNAKKVLMRYQELALLALKPTPVKTSVVPSKALHAAYDQMKSFVKCRYKQNLPFLECAEHVSIVGRGSMPLIELVSLIHSIQILYPASSRTNQRFVTFMLKRFISEYKFPTALSNNNSFREHFLQKVPIPPKLTCKNEYILHRLENGERLMPYIFSAFLETMYPHLHDSYMHHYTFFELIRLHSTVTTTFAPVSTTIDTFTDIYYLFIGLINDKGFYFISLHNEHQSLFNALGLFLEELGGYNDSLDLAICIKNLILFYKAKGLLNSTMVSFLLDSAEHWFNPAYLKDSA